MSFPTKTALVLAVVVAALGVGRTQSPGAGGADARESGNVVPLRAVQDEETGSIAIYREGEDEPIVTQNAGPGHRPFLHPIAAPDGNGLATQSSPDHHPHQTGLYWGFTRVNGEPMDEDTLRQWFYRRDKPADIARAVGRDYFHNPGGDYWRRDSAMVVTESGSEVKWADGLRHARRRRQRLHDRDAELDDAGRGRSFHPRSRMGRRSPHRRLDQRNVLRRLVPAHAPGTRTSRARRSTRRGSATPRPKASARCGSMSGCRSKAAKTCSTSPSSTTR